LQGVYPAFFGQALERGDLTFNRRSLGDARPRRRAIDDHCARPALAKSATKPRTLQAEIIAQDIEQRSRRVDIQGVRSPVHLQFNVAHYPFSLRHGVDAIQWSLFVEIRLIAKNNRTSAELAKGHDRP